MSVIAITATYLDMTFATTANITSVVETGDYFVRTVICTIIWASFPMSLVNDMKGEPMSDFAKDANVSYEDTISRQAAIEALEREQSLVERPITETRWFDLGLRKAQDIISELPSAQPEKRTEKRTETHACDCISRQAAIDVADAVWSVTGDKNVAKVWDQIKDLPSVQPEYYDYSDIDYVWKYYAEEQDINLTDGAKQLKDAMWVGYRKGKQAIQPEIIRCKDCKYITEHYDTDGNAPYWTCSEWDSGTDYDGFCHYAERRTDEKNT